MNKETAVKVLRRISGKTFHKMEFWGLSWSKGGKYHLKLEDAEINCPVWGSITPTTMAQPEFQSHRIIWVEKSLYKIPPSHAGYISLYHRAPGSDWNWDYGQICNHCLYAAWRFLIEHYGFKDTRAPEWLKRRWGYNL